MLFFVRVRIDVSKMAEMGGKLQSGELDKSHLKHTFCPQEDPSVGLAIWEAADRAEFETVFAPHRAYYADVMEVTPVVTPAEAIPLILARMQ